MIINDVYVSWLLDEGDLAGIRAGLPVYEVSEEITKHDSTCRRCGHAILKGEQRLAFKRTSPDWPPDWPGEKWTQSGYIHADFPLCDEKSSLARHPGWQADNIDRYIEQAEQQGRYIPEVKQELEDRQHLICVEAKIIKMLPQFSVADSRVLEAIFKKMSLTNGAVYAVTRLRDTRLARLLLTAATSRAERRTSLREKHATGEVFMAELVKQLHKQNTDPARIDPARKRKTYSRAVIANIRSRFPSPSLNVHESVGIREAGCRDCGFPILKGERRLTFNIEFDGTPALAFIHYSPCTAPATGTTTPPTRSTHTWYTQL